VQKFNPVEVWLDSVAYSHSDSEGTRINYEKYLKEFCDFIGRSPEDILKEAKGAAYMAFQSEYARYAQAFIAKKWKEGYAPNTLRSIATAIQSFFKHSKLPLAHIGVPRSKTVFHNRDIRKEEMVSILKVTRLRDKAFFFLMIQSGLRPGTLCKLRKKHLEPDFTEGKIPCCIRVPEDLAKGKYGSYFTFMGEEAVETLKTYFTTRSKMTDESYLFVAHGTEKPLSPKSFSAAFSRLARRLRTTGMLNFKGETGKPAELRLYSLRKFFRKYAGQAGIEYVNFWQGHKTDYQAKHIPSSDVHYFPREDIEFHRQLYGEKAMPFLRMETATPSETEQTIMELRNHIKQVEQGHQDELKKMEDYYKRETESIDDAMKQIRQDINELRELVKEMDRPRAPPKIVSKTTQKELRDLGRKTGQEINP